MVEIPYATPTKDDQCTRERIKHLREFIDFDSMSKPVLDIGEPNIVTDTLMEHGCENTLRCDLNRQLITPRLSYQTVFCFEVIEHLFAPLTLLDNIHRCMGDCGDLYLSTPLRNPYGFMHNETEHVTEYGKEPLMAMLRHAGFNPVRYRTFRSYPSLREGYRNGAGYLRGTIRMMSQRTQLIRAIRTGE